MEEEGGLEQGAGFRQSLVTASPALAVVAAAGGRYTEAYSGQWGEHCPLNAAKEARRVAGGVARRWDGGIMQWGIMGCTGQRTNLPTA